MGLWEQRKENLKAAVEREKAVQAIDVHRECKNCVVTFWVISQLLHFLGASRGCADFRDPTAVFRFNTEFSTLTQLLDTIQIRNCWIVVEDLTGVEFFQTKSR
jgi:hypothetical protein